MLASERGKMVISSGALLAIDLGLKTGFAVYGPCGQLRSYRSTRFPNHAAIKRAAWRVLCEIEDLTLVVMEGDARIADVWRKVARKRGAAVVMVAPHTWREVLLAPRERRSGVAAKRAADRIARELIAQSPAPLPTGRLTSDVAEAVLIGRWAVLTGAGTELSD